jgi:hypothetical protein
VEWHSLTNHGRTIGASRFAKRACPVYLSAMISSREAKMSDFLLVWRSSEVVIDEGKNKARALR